MEAAAIPKVLAFRRAGGHQCHSGVQSCKYELYASRPDSLRLYLENILLSIPDYLCRDVI
jgi:hypothetical protein